MEKRSRINDVAALAKVSTATVSHVINNTRFVSDEVRKRVLSAIKKLHYFPSATARSLSTKETKTVGVIISDIQNPFYGQLIRGIDGILHKEGYDILLASNDEDVTKENAYLTTFFSRGVDGIIMAPVNEDISFLEVIESVGTKIVFIDREPSNNPFPSILVNNKSSSKELINHLIDDGHERIAIILGLNRSTINNRFLGYKEALMERGIPFNKEFAVVGGSQQHGGYLAAKKLLNMKQKPTAIFTTVNLMTLGTLKAFHELGIRCPEDCALVGFDDTSWAPLFTPPLTTIEQPIKEIGITAANSLLEQLKGDDVPNKIELSTKLHVRGSCSTKCKNKYSIKREVVEIDEFPF